jgi:hypothetical protein
MNIPQIKYTNNNQREGYYDRLLFYSRVCGWVGGFDILVSLCIHKG